MRSFVYEVWGFCICFWCCLFFVGVTKQNKTQKTKGFVCAKLQCVESATHFHSAIDPALVFDYGSSKLWSLNESRLNESDFWTESK